MRKVHKKNLTNDDIMELLLDLAIQQSTREISGILWFENFCKRLSEMTYPKNCLRHKSKGRG